MLGLGIAKGMLTTLKHLVVGRPVTIQYPEQRMEMPAWTRGRPRLIYDLGTGDLRCTACGACAIACPVDVIKIEQHPGPDRKKVLDRFDLDMGGCIECALCVEACPFRAIVMAPDFEMAAYDRASSLVFNMHQLRIAGTPEVDAAMEYIQGVKRGLAGQAARGETPAGRPAAPGARPVPGAARPPGAAAPGAARPTPAAAGAARPAPGAGPARPAPAPGAPRPAGAPGAPARPAGAVPPRPPGAVPPRPTGAPAPGAARPTPPAAGAPTRPPAPAAEGEAAADIQEEHAPSAAPADQTPAPPTAGESTDQPKEEASQ